MENAAKFPLMARTRLRETTVLLVPVRKRFLAVSEHKIFCSPWWKNVWTDSSRACHYTDFLCQCRAPQLPGSNKISRFDSSCSDTCPPISSHTAQGVNKPKDRISVFTRRQEGGAQLEEITADNHQGRCLTASLLSRCSATQSTFRRDGNP